MAAALAHGDKVLSQTLTNVLPSDILYGESSEWQQRVLFISEFEAADAFVHLFLEDGVLATLLSSLEVREQSFRFTPAV